jgi:hypothetical protein
MVTRHCAAVTAFGVMVALAARPRAPLALAVQRMGKRALLVALLWVPACCNPSGRFPSDVKGGSRVRRDEFVDSWRVNGGKVCSSVIWAAPACYVLQVQYSATTTSTKAPPGRRSG